MTSPRLRSEPLRALSDIGWAEFCSVGIELKWSGRLKTWRHWILVTSLPSLVKVGCWIQLLSASMESLHHSPKLFGCCYWAMLCFRYHKSTPGDLDWRSAYTWLSYHRFRCRGSSAVGSGRAKSPPLLLPLTLGEFRCVNKTKSLWILWENPMFYWITLNFVLTFGRHTWLKRSSCWAWLCIRLVTILGFRPIFWGSGDVIFWFLGYENLW